MSRRRPAVSGYFYESNLERLRRQIEGCIWMIALVLPVSEKVSL